MNRIELGRQFRKESEFNSIVAYTKWLEDKIILQDNKTKEYCNNYEEAQVKRDERIKELQKYEKMWEELEQTINSKFRRDPKYILTALGLLDYIKEIEDKHND